MTVKERIKANLKAICKAQHTTIAELEVAIGKSAGYLSRPKNALSAEDLLIISKKLGYSMDQIANEDLAYMLKRESRYREIARLRAQIADIEKELESL